MNHRKTLAMLIVFATLCGPALAYTIYLKDGARIIAREKYTVDGEKAIITLQSGTQTFLDFAEIDVPRTDDANHHNLGTALILEDGQFIEKEIPVDNGPTRERLGDLIDRGEAVLRGPSPTVTDSSTPGTRAALSPKGDPTQRRPLRNLELAAAIKSAFDERGVEGVAVYQGTERLRPLIELSAESEASVFRNLEVAAEVLLRVRESFEAECELVELLMSTADHQRAGEFELTPELAQRLHSDSVDVASVFVDHVRF